MKNIAQIWSNFVIWVIRTPNRALDKAYKESLRADSIRKTYLKYDKIFNHQSQKFYKMNCYLHSLFLECINSILLNLLEFQVSQAILIFFNHNKPLGILQSTQISTQLCVIEKTILPIVSHDKFHENSLIFLSKSVSISEKQSVTAYEPIGLIPRSITKTFSRFQTELDSNTIMFVVEEFEIIQYQVIAILQHLFNLLFLPWLISQFCKQILLTSWFQYWWNTIHVEIFLNSSQERKALEQLQNFEDTSWLEQLIDCDLQMPIDFFYNKINMITVQLTILYNEQSLQALLNICMNFLALSITVGFFFLEKERINLIKSLTQEFFYSLSDTMKAFFILLFTDLFIGFHSPHAWEVLIESSLEYLGLGHNQYVVSLFVSTFPVILDTVFKYWIFRHLNRVAPSIVVTYHTMNE
uniref:Potassium/proton antiporter CemA n=1 Tax=Entransia fimbriata TaxID=130991 RepID=A0A191T4M3_9VIRI|nr:chloroplast enveloppe membrane protein [Entransia fimbriata]ANI25348.1 chloroplast enveloppe membrane protein [Entransia fimbriata]WKT05729.1 chloroplast enveloppe membrane protein [Entransia fimbriata]WKT05848.1 chloroplast enveloppe membrane protein [Entransia fimbriata]